MIDWLEPIATDESESLLTIFNGGMGRLEGSISFEDLFIADTVNDLG